MGRAILAHHPGLIERALRAGLPRYTSWTIANPEGLRRELARTRRQGYAVNNQEWCEGVCEIAAPVWDRAGSVVAVLSLSIPVTQFTKARLDVMVPVLNEIARDISRALGASGTEGSGPRPAGGRSAAGSTRGGKGHGARPAP
jgi:DNA-binding IclR family transcriptional regulator